MLTPNFSMYGSQPRTEHLINFRRNLLVAAELADIGVPAVPNLYWCRLEDLEREVAWIDDTRPPAVATNARTFRSDADWSAMLVPGLTYLAGALDDLGAPTKIVFTGLSRADRISQVFLPGTVLAKRDDCDRGPVSLLQLRLLVTTTSPSRGRVVVEAEHLCMSARGVRTGTARTVTSAVHGLLYDAGRSRQEFFALPGIGR